MKNRMRYLVSLACLAGAYYGAAKLGLSLASATPSVTAVWAPTGIALAALVLFGFRMWPGVAAGALAANAWTGVPALGVLGITAGNTLEALAGAYLLTRVVDFRPSLDRVSDVAWLVLLGAFASTAVSATIGSTSLLVTDEIAGSDFGLTWRTWWLGDMGGNLVVAPALLVAYTHWPYRVILARPFEAAGLLLLIGATVAFVFTLDDPVTFLLVPLPVVAAFRFRQPGAVAASLVTAAIAIPLTDDMEGPFASYAPDDRLVFAQLLVGVISLTALLIATVLAERVRTEDSMRSIATTLQESLLPADLPHLPGFQTAVHFQPAGEREIVGGDFYEVIESSDGTIGVAIGDALGKGAIAAADAALARYTLRTAALHESQPSAVLTVLNEAMITRSVDHPCTVAYVRVERTAQGAGLTVAIAGHPKPLILRADGGVEQVGHPSPPLGIGPDPRLTDHFAQLGPADALVLYTDGLTDAFAPRRVVSPDDLAMALRSYGGDTATEIVEAASRTAVPEEADTPPRDDILLLVMRVDDHQAA
jgi:serine phosphatase RsbU (regulator of sigma subunit)